MRLMVRGDKAYFTVPCLDGASHSTILDLDGNLESRIGSHNFEDEQVIEILGGEPSGCAKIHRIYNTALLCYKIKYGLADPANIVSNSDDEFWNCDATCSSCETQRGSRSSLKPLSHFGSAEHNAEVSGVREYSSLVKRLISWFERKGLLGIDSGRELSFETPELEYMVSRNTLSNSAISNNRIYSRARIDSRYSRNRYMLTPRYVRLANIFVGEDFDNTFLLRSSTTIERLEDILEQVGEGTIIKIRNRMFRKHGRQKNLATMLLANRSVPTPVIIDFMKAGIYANIYTYNTHNATAHQAVRIYEASKGTKTLKDYLLEGVTAVEAVRLAEGIAAAEHAVK